MNLFPSLFHHSGGAIYHWRALRNHKMLWSEHRKHTEAFLREWNPQAKTLVLIGPSGGYSLPKDWLKKFTTIIAYEPDAMARTIFNLRMGVKVQWIKKHFLFEEVSETTFPPGSAILFCNLLGQIHFDQEAGERAQEILEQLAQTHELASYHDALSGDHFRFEWTSPMDGDEPVRVKYEMEALDAYFSANEGITELDLMSHPAAYLFQNDSFSYQYWEWRITPTQTHVIESVYSRPK